MQNSLEKIIYAYKSIAQVLSRVKALSSHTFTHSQPLNTHALQKRTRKPRLFRAGMNGPTACIIRIAHICYPHGLSTRTTYRTPDCVSSHLMSQTASQGKIAERLEQVIHEVCQEHEWKVIRLAIQPDYVHLFLRSNPYTLPTDIAHAIKGRSSHLLREEFPQLLRMPSLWTRSTFYSTAGNVSTETTQNYIERQSTA
jgi:putative transposase